MKPIATLILIVAFSLSLLAQNPPSGSLSKNRAEQRLSKKPLSFLRNATPAEGSIHIDRKAPYDSYTPEDLIRKVFVKPGSCVLIENVKYLGGGWNGTSWNDPQHKTLAYFDKGTSTFPLSEGILMSTASLLPFEGPNEEFGAGIPPSGSVIGDSDLDNLLPSDDSKTKDVVALEFDFTPVSNTIEFRYIFASEEYPEYVNMSYNDVFGFFINEVGSSSKTNIALLPSSATSTNVVSINNVNNGWKGDNFDTTAGTNPQNPSYFIPNVFGSLVTEFDGYTVTLTAKYTVTPCKKYHLKLALGNVGDERYASGVFLEANSFSDGSRVENYGDMLPGISNKVYEGCQATLRILRTDALGTPQTVALSYSGSAVNGVDFQHQGGVLPASVVIPASDMYVDIAYTLIDNGISDNGKYFDVLASCPCSLASTSTERVYIYDAADISSLSISCSDLTINAVSGSGDYEYSIDGVSWQSSNTFSAIPLGNHTAWVRNVGSCNATKKKNFTIAPVSSVVNAGADMAACAAAESFTLNPTPLVAGETGSWSFVGPTLGATISNTSQANATVSMPSQGSVTLRWTVSNGLCYLHDDVVLTLNPPIKATFDITPNACKRNVDIRSVSGGSGSYQYRISGGSWASASTFSGLATGTHTLEVKDSKGCSLSHTLTVPAPVSATLSATHACNGAPNGLISITASGGDGNYQYSVDNGSNWQAGSTFNGLAAAQYNVMTKDGAGCQHTATATIELLSAIQFDVDKHHNTCNARIAIENVTGGDGSYEYSINGKKSWQPSNIFNGLNGGVHTVHVKDSNGCTADLDVELSTDYLTIKPDKIPSYSPLTPYSVQLLTSAHAPYTFSTNDMLPSGLSLSSSGEITGTPARHESLNMSFTVKLVDAEGCEVFKTYQLNCIPTIPEVITPNGDGSNDHFMKSFSVQIFDRFGTLIFEGDNGWDGKLKSKVVVPDTYFYVLHDGNNKKYTGHVTVLL